MRLALLCSLTALALAACSSPEPASPPTASPTVTATPLFASDEEALAAAETALDEYLAASDEVARNGGEGFEDLEPFVTEQQFLVEAESAAQLREGGIHAEGESEYRNLQLQSVSGTEVIAYVCFLNSTLRFFTSDGQPFAAGDVPDEETAIVRFSAPNSRQLRFDGVVPWAGASVC